MREISLRELVERTDEGRDALQRWRDLGLVGTSPGDSFTLDDVERARLIRTALRRGISEDHLAKDPKTTRALVDRFLTWLQAPDRVYSPDEAASAAGLDVELVRRLMSLAGTAPGSDIGDEEVGVLLGLRISIDLGFPPEALGQLVRVYSDALRRVAEAENRLFHIYFHDRLRMSGVAHDEVDEIVDSTATRLQSMTEPAIVYFHKRAFEQANREDFVVHLAEELGLASAVEVLGHVQTAIVFVDLSSFTPLTEAMGDAKAAEIVDRFSEIVRASSLTAEGRIVKQIGDEFMLVFPDARSAVACSLEIQEKIAAEPQFPAATIGIHVGPVLYREGDYLGSVVNLASRLTRAATRGQVLVTTAVRREAAGLDGVEFTPLGTKALKGLADGVEVFEARRVGHVARDKVIDLVCGMELRPGEAAARLTYEGGELHFCTTECLQRFVAEPTLYAGKPAT